MLRPFVFLTFALHLMAVVLTAAEKPNVIFILADDLGIGNVGCYGSDRYKTPHIDKLGNSGVRFDRFYVNSFCAPTRAAIRRSSASWRACIF